MTQPEPLIIPPPVTVGLFKLPRFKTSKDGVYKVGLLPGLANYKYKITCSFNALTYSGARVAPGFYCSVQVSNTTGDAGSGMLLAPPQAWYYGGTLGLVTFLISEYSEISFHTYSRDLYGIVEIESFTLTTEGPFVKSTHPD